MPAETHERYNRRGKLVGTTVIRRESEWNDYERARALALGEWDAGRCGSCGNYDSLVPLPLDLRDVTWDEHDGRMAAVSQFRCITCASAAIIERDWRKKHEKDEALPGQALPADGRMFVARPISEPSP